MSMLKNISTVGGFTLLSRIFGFMRDLLMARYIGVGMASDAFFIAFKLPNFFRRLFAEGAFAVGFVPLFSRALGKNITPESQKAAEAFASNILGWLFPILLIFLIIMEAAMVPIMTGLTGWENENPEKFDFVVELGRYMFPYLTLISLVSFFGGMLNAFGRFSAAAFAPIILNICMIAAIILFGNNEKEAAQALAISVSISGVVQLVWLYAAVRRSGLRISLPKPRVSEDVKEFMRIIAPAAVGAGVTQINLLIDVLIAARMLPEGSVSWLFFADRLAQLPLGVIGIAVGTVLLPSISRLLSAEDYTAANAQQNRALEFSLFLTLPAAAAFMLIAGPILATLFESEAFSSADVNASAAALMVYAAGLPAYVISKALTPGYFARKDTKTPVRFAIISLVINTALNLILIQYYAHVGLAAGTAIAAWVNAGLLYWGLKRRGHLTLERQTIVRLSKCLLATMIMAMTLYFASGMIDKMFVEIGTNRLIGLALLILTGVAVYGVSVLALRTISIIDLKSFVRRNA